MDIIERRDLYPEIEPFARGEPALDQRHLMYWDAAIGAIAIAGALFGLSLIIVLPPAKNGGVVTAAAVGLLIWPCPPSCCGAG